MYNIYYRGEFMNRVLSMILTLVFALSFAFAADLNVTKSVSQSDLNQGDTITINFDLDSNAIQTIRNNLDVVLAIDSSVSMWTKEKKLMPKMQQLILLIN